MDLDSKFSDLGLVVVGGLVTLFAMWWIYFDLPTEHLVERIRADFDEHLGAAFAWGYGHYFVFASIAATGAGLVVEVDQLAGHSTLTDRQASFAFTLPVALFLLSVWLLHARYKAATFVRNYAPPIAIGFVLLATFTSEPVLVTGLVLAALVGLNVAAQAARPAAYATHETPT
jgi:low temperature requirement protein LtrA